MLPVELSSLTPASNSENSIHAAVESTPLVSVAITTYNLEKLLPRALDSVLMQQRDFPIEIVIGDDASTDGTLQIAHAYRDKYPDMIRVLERATNVGVQFNTPDTLGACRGKYTACLDADDYWTDPEKLMVQVGVLESNPSVNVCAHIVRWVDTEGKVQRERYPSIAPGKYGIAEILHHNFIPTSSAMFRTGIHRQLPPWYFEFESLSDWPLWTMAGLSGDVILLGRIMADYMLTPGSSFMSKGGLYWHRADAKFYDLVESVLVPKLQRIARYEKGRRYSAISYELMKLGNFKESRKSAVKAFWTPYLMRSRMDKIKNLVGALVREMKNRSIQEQM